MTGNWFHIWQRRRWEFTSPPTLANLLALDGYDGFGGIEESNWLSYVDYLASELKIHPGDTVFEVGCGAGAFLYAWHLRGHRVSGIDYAANLVSIARLALPDANIHLGEATSIDHRKHDDFVASQGVFAYFPNLSYAADVLRQMTLKADKAVAILDVPDLALKDQSLAFRRGVFGGEAYNRKYSGLDHLYYDRSWFADILRDTNLKIRVEDLNIPGYAHSPYRFSVFIDKAERNVPRTG